MNQRILIGWAIGASVVAIAALSYIAGKQAGGAAATPMRPVVADTSVTQPGGKSRPAAPTYTVPEKFVGVPTEWRTATDASASGYVALFDPQRRELLVEQCAHPGYALEDRSALLDMNFCQGVLRARLAQLTDTAAAAVDRAGQAVQVRLEARLDDAPPTLRLRFDEHDAMLIPGSKNDYFQELEALPAIAAQKRAYMAAMMNQSRPGTPPRAPDQ